MRYEIFEINTLWSYYIHVHGVRDKALVGNRAYYAVMTQWRDSVACCIIRKLALAISRRIPT